MNILHLADRLDFADGAAKHVVLLAREQARRGHTVRIVTSGGGAAVLLEDTDVQCAMLPQLGHEDRSLRAFVQGMRLLANDARVFAPDIVHAHHFYAANLLWFGCRHLRPRLVQTVHAVIPPRGLLPHCPGRRLVAVSEAVRRNLTDRDTSLDARITVVRNGSDFLGVENPVRDAAEYRTILSLKRTHVVIAMLGRLTEVKGTRVLCEALGLLGAVGEQEPGYASGQESNAHSGSVALLVAGTGPDEAHLRAKADALGIPAVFFPPVQNVKPLLEAADLLLLPSLRMEGLPMLLVEAGLATRAVIASRTDGVPEIITHEDTGLLAEPGDAAALAAAIRRLISDAQLRALLAARLHARVLHEFTVSAMTDSVLHLYERLRQHPRPAR